MYINKLQYENDKYSDQTPSSGASDLGLHCMAISNIKGTWIICIDKVYGDNNIFLNEKFSDTIDHLLFTRHVDFINLMLYDFHGSWENTVNVHSSMYSDDGLNVVSYTFPP